MAASRFSTDPIVVELVSADGRRQVPSGITGLELAACGHIDVKRSDVLIVPGAAGSVDGDGPDSVPAILLGAIETALPPHLATVSADPTVVVATVCGGSLLLAMAGLIERRFAVTHTWAWTCSTPPVRTPSKPVSWTMVTSFRPASPLESISASICLIDSSGPTWPLRWNDGSSSNGAEPPGDPWPRRWRDDTVRVYRGLECVDRHTIGRSRQPSRSNRMVTV